MYVGRAQLLLAKKEDEKVEASCLLTHSPKEEFEEVKERLVFSVRPEQIMP